MRDGIDAADALVFVISPKSLASKACREELDHASAEHKRLIGVLRVDVEGLDVPSAIEGVNWVYLRATDDFGVGLSALGRALDLDLDLVRIHTRVLTRAKAWELAGRRPTPLLRGEELRAAEGWLARAATGVEPQPTELQAAFVHESRRRASRRQRFAVSGSLAIAVVAIGLATFALIQRAQARHEARIARSRELAARAAPELASNPEHAIALAAQGLRVQPTAQARHTLLSALQASRLRADLRQSSPVGAVTFSPDGTLLAVGGDDGAMRLWRLSDRRVLWSQGRGEPAVTSVSFSGRGDLLAVARSSSGTSGTGCSVKVLGASTGAVRRVVQRSVGDPCGFFAQFLGKTRTLATATDDGTIQVVDTDKWEPFRTITTARAPPFSGSSGFVYGMGFSPDGRLAASGSNDDVVRVVSLRSGRVIARIAHGLLKPAELAFNSGGKLLIGAKNTAEIYDLRQHRVATDLGNNSGATSDAAWGDDGRLIAGATGGGITQVWSASSYRHVGSLAGATRDGMTAVAFSSTGLLAGGSTDGSLRIWEPDPDLPNREVRGSGYLRGVGAGGVHLAAFADEVGGVVLVDDQGRERARLRTRSDSSIAVGRDGYVAFMRGARLEVIALPSGRSVRSWPTRWGDSLDDLTLSADGKQAAGVTYSGLVTVFSPRSRRSRRVPTDQDVDVMVEMSPDARLVAVAPATHPAGVRVLRTSDLATVRTVPGEEPTFSPSGARLAVRRPDNSIAIVRTSDWSVETVLRGAASATNGLAFSPDERLLAEAGVDHALRVWDVGDGTLLATRVVTEITQDTEGTDGAVDSPVLTAAGYALVSAHFTQSIDAYDICGNCFQPSAILAQAAARLREIRPVVGS